MIKFLSLTVFVLINFLLLSQEGFYLKDYNWSEKPMSYELSEDELKKDEITLLEKYSNHFFDMDEQYIKCVLEHKIIRLNTDKGIENNNKFYVSNAGALEVFLQKARAISPKGDIIELSSKDVKVAKDENGEDSYQYFAFEGIEKGSVIEYMHVMTFPASYSGREVKVQSYYDKKNVEYELVCPKHLFYKINSVNGLPEFLMDTTENGSNRYYLHLDTLEGLEYEPSSAYDASLKKYYYMLFKNLATGKSNFYNYQDITKDVHQKMFATLNSKEEKGLKKLIKECGISSKLSLRDKVFLLENHLKSNFVVQDVYFEGAFDIVSILKTRMCTENGLTKMMLNCLKILDIECELVLTCDRYENKFVNDFQGYNFLEKYLIYVKDLDGYYVSDVVARFGFPPTEFIPNEGLFIKEINLNGLISSIGKVKQIENPDMNKSIDEMYLNVGFSEDNLSLLIDIKRTSTGYKAFYQSIIDYVSDSQLLEFKQQYLNYIDDETIPTDIEFINDSSKYYGYKPFIGKGKLESSNFIEHAGDNLLFKVGMLIGPQSNLYNSKERKLAVETDHAKKYIRTINFTIPEGYSVKNLSELNMKVTPDFNNGEMGFVSTYEVEGNKLIIKINEWYNCVIIPVENYKDYENVVNAAANFNKLKLVLNKD